MRPKSIKPVREIMAEIKKRKQLVRSIINNSTNSIRIHNIYHSIINHEENAMDKESIWSKTYYPSEDNIIYSFKSLNKRGIKV